MARQNTQLTTLRTVLRRTEDLINHDCLDELRHMATIRDGWRRLYGQLDRQNERLCNLNERLCTLNKRLCNLQTKLDKKVYQSFEQSLCSAYFGKKLTLHCLLW